MLRTGVRIVCVTCDVTFFYQRKRETKAKRDLWNRPNKNNANGGSHLASDSTEELAAASFPNTRGCVADRESFEKLMTVP